jgi:hypothetical protein
VNILARIVDERFLAHRQRSTSVAGMATAATALLLFEYRYWVDRVPQWDLLAVGAMFVVIKLSLMAWYAARH